jgi:hypothetical protein
VLRRASRVPERHVHRHEPLPLYSCAMRTIKISKLYLV